MENPNSSVQMEEILSDFIQSDEVTSETPSDEAVEAAAEVLGLEEAPDTEVVEDDSNLEVSEEEQESSEDEDSNVEVAEDGQEDDAEETVEDADTSALPVVDYDEAKGYVFELDGENFTIDQIKSWKGQVGAASKAQNEIDSVRKEIEAERQAFEDEKAQVTQQREALHLSQGLGVKAAQIQEIQKEVDAARESGDPTALVLAKDKYDVARAAYDEELATVQQAQKEALDVHIATEQRRLSELGYATLLSDEQRAESLMGYLNETLSGNQQLIEAVLNKAELTIAFEEARMYRQSQKTKANPKAKLKGKPQKTLRAGSGDVKQPKPKSASLRDLTQEMANEVLGL